jgi:MATE family multidrug resistance protein
MKMDRRLSYYWNGEGGCGEVFKIALPLIISTSAYTIQMFIDRVFLMWYSSDAMAAAMFSGMADFTIYSLFLGTALYVNTFVAQYDGAGRVHRVGAAVWQGIYFSIGAGLLMAAVAPFAGTIVGWAGHEAAVQRQEATYLQILLIGSLPALLSSVLGCFYTGRAKMWTVMWVNVGGTVVNIVLDYAWIFGHWGFGRRGIAGAAWATVAASVFTVMAFTMLFLRQEYREKYQTFAGWRLDGELFMRMMRFGVPSGVQFMLDIIGWSLFLAFIGRINMLSLTATAIAFQINTLAFMPMIGFSTAVSTLVGRYLGADTPSLAARSTWSAMGMTMAYMMAVALGYWLLPDVFMYPFAANADTAQFAMLRPLVMNLLLFVAFYSLFDSGNLIFSAAVKGAGDTRFVMIMSVVLSWVVLIAPSYLAIRLVGGLQGLYLAWTAATAYVCLLAVAFMLRFIAGKWKTMRVIEVAPRTVAVAPIPTGE